jgi:hypothetical protein
MWIIADGRGRVQHGSGRLIDFLVGQAEVDSDIGDRDVW